MALTAKGKNTRSTKDQDVPEKGAHMARVVGLTDLGHQPSWEWAGETIKDSYKITFTYELVGSEMEDGRPHWVSEDVNVNDFEGEGISSTMMLRVRAIDPQNETQDGQDLSKLINKPCMVTVSHNAKGYAKVKNVGGVPMGLQVAELRNPTFSFDIDNPDLETFHSFSDFVKKKIKGALNYPNSALKKALDAEEGQF
jgi:hypothetical protein